MVARRRLVIVGALSVVAVVLMGFVLDLPVETRRGVNSEVSIHREPLYLKVGGFVTRSGEYRQLAREIVANASTDEAKALAVFEWTIRRIPATPDGWAIVDDHILNIIIRGHGAADQQADVFATLTTYAGVPAFWRSLKTANLSSHRQGLVLTFVQIDDRWRVFDVRQRLAFRTPGGQLATFDELRAHPEWVPAAARDLDIDGVSYGQLLARLSMPPVPRTSRSALQMPGPRLLYELRTTLGIETPHEPD